MQKKNPLDTRFRGYDGTVGFVFLFGSCSLCSHFAYFRFAWRRGVSTIPDGDTKSPAYRQENYKEYPMIQFPNDQNYCLSFLFLEIWLLRFRSLFDYQCFEFGSFVPVSSLISLWTSSLSGLPFSSKSTAFRKCVRALFPSPLNLKYFPK